MLTHTRLEAVVLTNGRVAGVELEGAGGRRRLACDLLVNAAGPWAGRVSELYGDPIRLTLGAASC